MTELCCIGRLAGDGTEDDAQRVHFQGRAAVDGDRLESTIPTRPNGKALHAIVPCFVAATDPSDLLADVDTEIIAEVAALDGSPSVAEKRRLQRIADRHSLGTIQKPRDLIARLGRKLDPDFDERGHLGRGEAPPVGSFVSDTFTDTSGLALASHTGETGATWTEHGSYSTGDAVISDANRARINGATATCYYASGSPATAEYTLEGTLYVASKAGNNAVAGRIVTGANTMYYCRTDAGADWQLYKMVAGAATALGNYVQSLTVAAAYVETLELLDATKKIYIDGIERISSTDNAITGAGKVGIRGATGTNSTGFHFDSLTASDPGGAPARRQSMVA